MTRLLAGTLVLFLCGCSEDSHRAEHRPDIPPDTLPGVYAGTFPCANCDGIATTLWLRPDHAFFLRQRYLDESEGDFTVHSLGRWRWDEVEHTLRLAAPGPARVLSRPDHHRLRLVTRSEILHTLTREPDAAEFTDRIRIQGQLEVSDDRISFTECLSGVTAEVEEQQAHRKLVRQSRRFGTPGRVELDARFNWHEGELAPTLIADEVIAYQPYQPC